MIFLRIIVRKRDLIFYSQSEVSRLVRMRYVLIHDSVEETEITDTRRKTQTLALILVKKKKKNTR